MLTVFIGYGGSKGESVAEELEKFLETEAKMDVFLASPKSCSLPANSHNFIARINQEMIGRHIAIFICHEGSIRSKALIKEIDFLVSNSMTNRVDLSPYYFIDFSLKICHYLAVFQIVNLPAIRKLTNPQTMPVTVS